MRRDATPEEDLVWERLRGRRFHGLRLRRQHAIGPFMVDFYCHEKQLIVEVDGGIHKNTVQQDTVRQQHLENLGFTLLRLDSHEVTGNLDRGP
jgi:very-short-patch-repair endonuclease